MTILCYHAVDPDWVSPLAVQPAAFARQLDRLRARRTVLPLAAAVERLDRQGRLPRGFSALTFDDGFESLYDHAFPLLRRRGLPATVFLVVETLLPAGRPVDWVDTPPPPPRRLTTLSRSQVKEMQDAGVTFASHSLSHHDLTTLAFDDCVADLRRSREVLEDLLGHRVPFLAYPRGRNNDAVRAAAAVAGYTHSFTLPERREPAGQHGIPRVGIYPGNSPRIAVGKTDPAYLTLRLGPLFPPVRHATRTVGRHVTRWTALARDLVGVNGHAQR